MGLEVSQTSFNLLEVKAGGLKRGVNKWSKAAHISTLKSSFAVGGGILCTQVTPGP